MRTVTAGVGTPRFAGLRLRAAHLQTPLLPALVPGLVALAICVYQLSRPHAFWGVHGADDGLYLGAALRLAHGALPYRDFAFVHPPGMAVLMGPLGIFRDTRDAMAGARVVTAFVTGLNA